MVQKEVPAWHENQNLGVRLGGELQVCIGAGSKPEAKQGCDYTNKKSLLEVPVFLAKRKTRVAQPVIAPPPPAVYQPCFLLGLPGLSRALSGAEPVAQTVTGTQGKQQRMMTVHVTELCFHRAGILAGIFAGQEGKGSTQELRELQRCVWQPGQVSVAKHFVNSGPDSPL